MTRINCVNFDDFINPHGNLERFKNKNLDINYIYPCSHVFYFVIEHCNGEIINNFCILNIDDKKDLLKYFFSSYVIYAINFLDKIVCEVI